MTIEGAIKQLCELRDNSMMPRMFRPYLDEVITTLQDEAPHWRPCSQSMPDEYGLYLVCNNRGGVFASQYSKSGFGRPNIVAWMPLPEAYSDKASIEAAFERFLDMYGTPGAKQYFGELRLYMEAMEADQ